MKGYEVFLILLIIGNSFASWETSSWYIAVSDMPEYKTWCLNEVCKSNVFWQQFIDTSRLETGIDLQRTLEKKIISYNSAFNSNSAQFVIKAEFFCNSVDASELQPVDMFNYRFSKMVDFDLKPVPFTSNGFSRGSLSVQTAEVSLDSYSSTTQETVISEPIETPAGIGFSNDTNSNFAFFVFLCVCFAIFITFAVVYLLGIIMFAMYRIYKYITKKCAKVDEFPDAV